MAHGARFLVSPVTDEVVIRRAAELGVASIPGGHTPTELLAAHRAGAPLVQALPGSRRRTGVAALAASAAALPQGGAHQRRRPRQRRRAGSPPAPARSASWRSLFQADDMRQRRYDRIEARAREILERVRGQAVAAPAEAARKRQRRRAAAERSAARRHEPDLEERRPELAGEQEVVRLRAARRCR